MLIELERAASFLFDQIQPPPPERECPGAPGAALGPFISALNFWCRDQRSSCARAVPGEGGLHQKHPCFFEPKASIKGDED